MRILTCTLWSALLLGFATCAMADSAFDGKWTAEIIRGPATKKGPNAAAPAGNRNQTLTITLNTQAGKVTGTMLIEGAGAGESPIEWGVIKGDLITFNVKMPGNDPNAVFVYLGKLDGDQVAFGRRPVDLTQGGLVEFTAQRAK